MAGLNGGGEKASQIRIVSPEATKRACVLGIGIGIAVGIRNRIQTPKTFRDGEID